MLQKRFIKEIEKAKKEENGRPTVGPVYRSIIATDNFPPNIQDVESCWDIFRLSVEKYPHNRMLGHYKPENEKSGEFVWLTYKEVYDIVLKVGRSIRWCGIGEGARCGIYGANCPQWIISMEACNAHGLYCVPLYDSLGARAIEFVICHSEISIVFLEERNIPEILKSLPETKRYLRTIVSFGKVSHDQRIEIKKFGLEIYSWEEFLLLGHNVSFDLPSNKRSGISTIMYTSGTTGDPKGVMISNDNIITFLAGVKCQLESTGETFNEDDVYLSYLPLAHIYDRVMEELLIYYGASIGFWRGDVKLLIEDIRELKPTILSAVPRVLDRIYSGLTEKIFSASFLKQKLFNAAYLYKLHNMKMGYKHLDAAPLCDKIVFSKVKESLGGRIRLILSGAAPLANHVETYLRVVTCADVLQGYGLTETCGGAFAAISDELSMIGTVGPPLPSVDVCLESVPEMGYDALSGKPKGEICVRGKTLFSGYYKSENLTRDVMVDGWFHTGDIGEWQPDGCMKIIDRKKNIFKLSQGEYVAVEYLETLYGSLNYIDSIWVYGNSLESFLVAVVSPNKEAIKYWAEENGVRGDFSSLCGNSKVKEHVLEELSEIAKERKLKGYEFIKAIHLDPIPFDMKRGLLTPSYKKRRPQLLKYYQNSVDGMYTNRRAA